MEVGKSLGMLSLPYLNETWEPRLLGNHQSIQNIHISAQYEKESGIPKHLTLPHHYCKPQSLNTESGVWGGQWYFQQISIICYPVTLWVDNYCVQASSL